MNASDPKPLVVGCWPGRPFPGNPFIATFCDSLGEQGVEVVDVHDPRAIATRLDILHIHWPEKAYWGKAGLIKSVKLTFATIAALARIRKSGTHLVWMVHNLKPHDLRGTKHVLWPPLVHAITRLCSGFMTLSPSTIDVVRSAYPALRDKPAAAALHPAYRTEAPPQYPRPPGRHRTFLFAGRVRPYKGVENLIAAFRETGNGDWRLIVAGDARDERYLTELEAHSRDDGRISIVPGRLAPQAFDALLTEADAMVLPYRSYLHSGAMVHALSHHLPVITPRHPYADDIAQEVGADWVCRYDGKLCGDVLEDWIAPTKAPEMSSLHRSRLAEAAVGLYRKVLSQAL